MFLRSLEGTRVRPRSTIVNRLEGILDLPVNFMQERRSEKFDDRVDRTGTRSVKWDNREEVFGRSDVLPMWVADSDWQTAQPIIDAIVERAKHGVFGYTSTDEETDRLIVDWFEDRHGWSIEPEWIVYGNGVVPSLRVIIGNLTDQGDGVILQPPVYYPFFTSVRYSGSQILTNQLQLNGDVYSMNFPDLKNLCQPGDVTFPTEPTPTTMVLCNPHNPVGRVWKEEELRKLGRICLENDILVVSDDIHSEFVYDKNEYVAFASLSEDFARNSITLTSPSKAFNTAGLPASVAIIPDEKTRTRFKRASEKLLKGPSVFGLEAMSAGYRNGKEWLEDQLEYLKRNRDYSISFFERETPDIRTIEPEGTTLLWMDFRKLGLSSEELEKLILEEARVGLDFGHWFGPGGEGFLRLNFACPRSILQEGLERIGSAVEEVS